MPAAQYILYPLDTSNLGFFTSKPKSLQDKTIPDTLVSLKFAKKHIYTQEARDRVVKEVLESLTLYLAANGNSIAFPELIVPICVLLSKFKKQSGNTNYKKSVQAFLDLLQRQETFVAQHRAKIKDKSLKDPAKLFSQFSAVLQSHSTQQDGKEVVNSPLAKEQAKLERAHTEEVARKMQALK